MRASTAAPLHFPRAGKEVTISYGNWPNDLFYLLFGFVPEENPYDSVVLFRNLEDAATFIARLQGTREDEPLKVGGSDACAHLFLTLT